MAIWWKPELERVGDTDDLEDPALDQPIRAGPDRGLGDAELGGDLRVRSATVRLEVLDDPLVEVRHVVRPSGDRRPWAAGGVPRSPAAHGAAVGFFEGLPRWRRWTPRAPA